MGFNKKMLLIVDDDVNRLELIHRTLYNRLITTPNKAVSVKEAYGNSKRSKFDLVIPDLRMPRCRRLTIVKYVSEHYPKASKIWW